MTSGQEGLKNFTLSLLMIKEMSKKYPWLKKVAQKALN